MEDIFSVRVKKNNRKPKLTWALFWHDALTWCCASATESIRRHKQRHRHVIRVTRYLLYFPAPWNLCQNKTSSAGNYRRQNQWQTGSEQESVLCLLCGFCWRLSSHGNTESKPERQMSAKSDRSNTLRSLFIENQDLSCSFTEALQAGAGSQWLYFYYIAHTRMLGVWGGGPLKPLCLHRGAICCH